MLSHGTKDIKQDNMVIKKFLITMYIFKKKGNIFDI
jgi:hypothetical protein